ncbi:hypothetical protein AAG906_022362 [Vitis piasezkii]
MMPRCSISPSSDVQLFHTFNGIQQLSQTHHFKAWFLDQFGVLHDGKQPYPGAISTLEKLATSGAKMVIISNSSRRSSITIEKMKSLGFDPSLSRDDAWFAKLGRSCIHMTWSDRGAISLEGLGLQVVDKVEEAEFVLAHGTEALGLPSGAVLPMKLEDLEKILGALAAKYEKLGGEVKWMGKPDKIIYKSAMAMVGVDASDCIAVGDSLHHDIKGANVTGIQSAFITGGIHANELGLGSFGEVADSSSVQALASKYDAHPSYQHSTSFEFSIFGFSGFPIKEFPLEDDKVSKLG